VWIFFFKEAKLVQLDCHGENRTWDIKEEHTLRSQTNTTKKRCGY